MNSWFAFGRFQTNDGMMNYLFHIMQLEFPKLMGGRKYQVVITLLNESTGKYYAKDYLFKASEVTVNLDKFYLKVPNGLMEGTLDSMHLMIDEKPADFKLDTTTKAIHYPVMSGGTSVFELLGMCIHQFSIPYMATSGTFEWGRQKYDITNKGYTWFDRQWQNQDMKKPIKWSWMAIYLENGDVISVLNCDVPEYETSLLANLKSDGTQINGMGNQDVLPFKKGESDYYYNSKSKQEYPSHWIIEIPKINTKLEIIPAGKREQDITSVFAPLSKYEGVTTVKGIYQGKEITGTALVELIGSWPKHKH
ncbi:MAG: lipocalin-like domain-containing protein [Moheibacter sp.]